MNRTFRITKTYAEAPAENTQVDVFIPETYDYDLTARVLKLDGDLPEDWCKLIQGMGPDSTLELLNADALYRLRVQVLGDPDGDRQDIVLTQRELLEWQTGKDLTVEIDRFGDGGQSDPYKLFITVNGYKGEGTESMVQLEIGFDGMPDGCSQYIGHADLTDMLSDRSLKLAVNEILDWHVSEMRFIKFNPSPDWTRHEAEDATPVPPAFEPPTEDEVAVLYDAHLHNEPNC